MVDAAPTGTRSSSSGRRTPQGCSRCSDASVSRGRCLTARLGDAPSKEHGSCFSRVSASCAAGLMELCSPAPVALWSAGASHLDSRAHVMMPRCSVDVAHEWPLGFLQMRPSEIPAASCSAAPGLPCHAADADADPSRAKLLEEAFIYLQANAHINFGVLAEPAAAQPAGGAHAAAAPSSSSRRWPGQMIACQSPGSSGAVAAEPLAAEPLAAEPWEPPGACSDRSLLASTDNLARPANPAGEGEAAAAPADGAAGPGQAQAPFTMVGLSAAGGLHARR
jgi:hypothetical protein